MEACKDIYNYIITNTNKIVARYYFGQVKKNQDDSSSCGTCGAGVPYIGRVINKIKDLRQTQTTIPNPVTFSPIPPAPIDDNLNRLKTNIHKEFNSFETKWPS
jgi:hypothetical protein